MAKNLERDFTLMNKYIIFSLLILISFSCKKDKTNQQNLDFFDPVFVDFTVNMDLPDAAELKFPNGFMYSANGYKGIIIYNTGFPGADQYVAFDRACPYKTDSICSIVTMESNNLFYVCGKTVNAKFVPCCGSKFAAQNGGVVSGSATRSLKQYYVYQFGSQLRVTNTPL
jgi:hypothetical protein